MPATVTTKEPLEAGIDEAALEREMKLRLKAGAIRCEVKEVDGKKFLFTEWNVIGEQ